MSVATCGQCKHFAKDGWCNLHGVSTKSDAGYCVRFEAASQPALPLEHAPEPSEPRPRCLALCPVRISGERVQCVHDDGHGPGHAARAGGRLVAWVDGCAWVFTSGGVLPVEGA